MLYCPPNITFTNIWVKHGISHCFLDTVTSSTYGLFMLLFGLAQWAMYRRYATPCESFIRPKSHLFKVQLALSGLLPLLATLQIILLSTIVGKFFFNSYPVKMLSMPGFLQVCETSYGATLFGYCYQVTGIV